MNTAGKGPQTVMVKGYFQLWFSMILDSTGLHKNHCALYHSNKVEVRKLQSCTKTD